MRAADGPVAPPAAVEVSGLRKRYGDVVALDGVNLAVQPGAILGLVGPNGAGKTTLIRSLVGALRPTEGSVQVLGLDPMGDRWRLRPMIGYMPQSAALYEDLTARDNVAFFARGHHTPDLEARVEEVLEFTELLERADDPVSQFSGGMKKRASLACALVHQPRVLFLDEPTAAVDPHLREKSWQLFRALAARGVTLFISSHQMDEALLCDRIVVLQRGQIIADDTPGRILEAGRARLAIRRAGAAQESSIEATPEALAAALRPFGLASEVEAVDIRPDSLDDVILAIIRSRDES